MLSKPLIQFSVDGGSRVPSLVFGLRPNYGRGNGIMETSFKRTYAHTAGFSAPDPSGRPLSIHTSARDSQTLTGEDEHTSFYCTILFRLASPSQWKRPQVSYPHTSKGRQNENHNHRKLTKLITWITALSNSMKL